ncbi:MAG: hypothetical protein JST73_00905 [Actinobacteria bacterium]|nr:hypothetical protein [Actinomycetota bacterium]
MTAEEPEPDTADTTIGRWVTDGNGRPAFEVEVTRCPGVAWHLVGAPGLCGLAHVDGTISLFATTGGMVRMADRTALICCDGIPVRPNSVRLEADGCVWTFDHGDVHLVRTLRAAEDRPELTSTWVVEANRRVRITEHWRCDAYPLIAAPLMSRRIAPPSTHHGFDRLVWHALFTVSDAARRLTDTVRSVAGRRHPLGATTDRSHHTVTWRPDRPRRRPNRPRWSISVPPTLQLDLHEPSGSADIVVDGAGPRIRAETHCSDRMTARVRVVDPLIGSMHDPVRRTAALPIPQVRDDAADVDTVLEREAYWHVAQLRALRVPDPFTGHPFVMQGSAYGFIHGLHGAVRDEAFVVAALADHDPTTARDALISMAAMARPDGRFHYAHTGFGAVASGGVHASPTDLGLFMLWALTEYVAATGDLDVLDATVRRRGAAMATPPVRVAQVATAAVRALDAHVGVGPHGMLRVGSGDWADPISLMVRHRSAFHRHGESTFNTAMALAVLPGAARLLERFDATGASRCRSWCDQLDGALETAWNGRWYRRGWDGRGGAIGDDHCFLDAQVWALIAGHGTPARRADLVATLRSRLDRSSPIGPTCLDRPHRVRMGMLADGWDCNGGVWAALGGLCAWAYALHEPRFARDTLWRQSFAHRRRTYPDIWYGQWSGPDATNAHFGDRPGGTFVQPATPMAEFPVMNSNAHAGPLLGFTKLAASSTR